MKVFVTGVAGYIGSTLSKMLLSEGYQVAGIDKLLFGGKSLLGLLQSNNFRFIKEDLHNTSAYESLIDSKTAIVHLAAIVGEPASRKMPEETMKTNLEATRKIIELAIKKKIRKFVFASTCSNYGKNIGQKPATEQFELKPLSLYANTKVQIENYLANDVKDELNWTILRIATVYGISPRLRFDLTVNDFTMHAIIDKKLVIFLPKSNRPYVHVQDAAKAVQLVLNNVGSTAQEVFNVGCTKENYRKMDIVNKIKKIVGDFDLEYVERGKDLRDYKVSFEKIKRKLNYKTAKTVSDGIKEVAFIIKNRLITDFDNKEYYNS